MKKLWKGNIALAEGAVAGGLDAYFGYPITPQNEIPEYMSSRMREIGKAFLQAESELAAINMVFGTALTGKKAMTTSSSPGISLMQETISYMVGCEVPAVIVNVQRGGPGLGNIAGSQGDYFQATKGGGHGDHKYIVLTPATVEEMYEMSRDAFDLAFKYRNPVMILSDGIIGQMIEPVDINMDYPEQKKDELPDLGWNLTGAENRDSRFIRSLLMEDNSLELLNYKLADKYEAMKDEVVWEEKGTEDADLILIGYGTGARLNFDLYNYLRKKGVKIGYIRLKTVFPFPSERINELSQSAELLVVELSLGQLIEDVKLSCSNEKTIHFYGKPGGALPDFNELVNQIEGILK